ncbi:hypothetical protein Tco_1327190, partial [Tanacetum coccineum]
VYKHELKGASSSNSLSIAFMSAEIKGSTSRQSTADDKSEIITKGYAQASSSKLKETLNSSFNSDEIICSFFAQQASMPETYDDEDLLQIDDDEEIDIRWQVAMITARIRKFMRKNRDALRLKPKNGFTFGQGQRLNAFTLSRSWALLLGNASLLIIRQTEQWKFDADLVGLGQDGLGVLTERRRLIMPQCFALMLYQKRLPIIPPRADVAFTRIDELAIRNKVINKQNSESSGTDHESCPYCKDLVDSDDEEVLLGFSEIKKQTILKSKTSSENKSPRRLLDLLKESQTDPKNLKTILETQGSRDSRSVWNNTSRVNHRNFSSDYRHPHQRRSFIPSAVLTREGLKSTVRSKMSQVVPSQSTASAFYQNTARPNVSKAVLSQTSDEEIEGPMTDQPLSAYASPTALSPGYIADSDPEEDKET